MRFENDGDHQLKISWDDNVSRQHGEYDVATSFVQIPEADAYLRPITRIQQKVGEPP